MSAPTTDGSASGAYDEGAAISTITAVCLEMLGTDERPVRRQQHPWHHACLRAEFRVASDIPSALRHGVFAHPARFDAIVRLSTGSKRDERSRDVHGLALKLIGVPGAPAGTQDFILLDSPVFFIRNAADYAQFATAMLKGFRLSRRVRPRKLGDALMRPMMFASLYRDFFRSHKREAELIKSVRRKPGDPLQRNYWSATPYRLGPHVIRYHLRPVGISSATPLPNGSETLRAALARYFASGFASFELFVQVATDPVTMPVEDPTVLWDELVAVPRRVGTLTIGPQQFDAPRKRALSETLSFSPDRGLAEHGPLGSINRSRAVTYQVLAARRRELNGDPAKEPDSRWLDEVWDAALPGANT